MKMDLCFLLRTVARAMGALLLGGGISAFALEFEDARFFDSGVNPYQLALADFNDDGEFDVAVANTGIWPRGEESSLSILFGDGAGNFSPAVVYPVGLTPHGLVVGDINEDTLPDVIVINRQPYAGVGTLSVYLNSPISPGSFILHSTVNSGSQPMHADLGYLDDDDFIDLAVVAHGSNQALVFLGDGSGGFSLQSTIGTGGGPNGIAIANLNPLTDSLPDIVTSNWKSFNASIILNNATTGLSNTGTYLIGRRSWTVDTADLNEDGFADIIAPNSLDKTLSVLLGDGKGEFSPLPTLGLGFASYDFSVADIDLDGLLDFVTGKSTEGVKLFLGDGNGSFMTPALPYPLGPQASNAFPCVRVADLNHDGFPDLVATENGLANPALEDDPTIEPISVFLQVPNLRPDGVLSLSEEVIAIGDSVLLDATGTTDQENDLIYYSWSIESAPLGSSASIDGATTVAGSFFPDLPGVYEISLTVSDYIGPAEPIVVELLVLPLTDYAMFHIESSIDLVCDLRKDQVYRERGFYRRALKGKLYFAKLFICKAERHEYFSDRFVRRSISVLDYLVSRVDGCSERGEPDVPRSGNRTDWVTSCPEQEDLHDSIREAIRALRDVLE